MKGSETVPSSAHRGFPTTTIPLGRDAPPRSPGPIMPSEARGVKPSPPDASGVICRGARKRRRLIP